MKPITQGPNFDNQKLKSFINDMIIYISIIVPNAH